MSARGLKFLREKTGIEESNMAVFITVTTSIYLITGDEARTAANLILTVVPVLLTYVYPLEKPADQHLLVYW